MRESAKELEDQALSARLQEEKARREREALIAQQALAAEASANNPDLLDESPTPNNAIGIDAELSSDAVLEEKPPVALVETDDNPATPIVSDVDYLEAARSAVDRADSMEAIDLYWRALGPGSENPVIWYELADVYMEAQNWLDAEACILEAKRRDPRSPIIVSAYLTIVAQTQAPSKAVREAEALVNLFPREPSVSLAYARLLKKPTRQDRESPTHTTIFSVKRHPARKGSKRLPLTLVDRTELDLIFHPCQQLSRAVFAISKIGLESSMWFPVKYH